MLNPGDPNHLWLLHALFLDDIDEDCQVFRDEWNCHGTVLLIHPLSNDTKCRIYAS